MKYKLIKPINDNYSTIEQILTNRGIQLNEVYHYLHTTDNDINPPELLGEQKLQAAAASIIKTIQSNLQAIVIIDSDADGFTSAAVLINYLHDLFPYWVQNKITYVVHSGKQHGLNDHLKTILSHNYSLVIVPDAGSNDKQECKILKENEREIIILDHHICDEENPYAIVINNQLSDYPNKSLSGVGVVWQFCRYLDKLLKTNNADNYLDLVALGLCADMMSMTSIETKHLENKGFKQVKNPFFLNLTQKNSYSMKNKINHMSVAFYVAPYINAICRSGTEDEKMITFESMLKYKTFQILPSTKRGHKLGDTQQLVEQAMRVVTNVKARQTKAQDTGLQTIESMINDKNLLNHKVLLFLLEPGQVDRNIAGLIANKIMAKYQRPVCILTKVIEEKEIKDPVKIRFFDNNKFTGEPYKEWDMPPYDPPYHMIITSYQGSARGCDKVGINDFKTICAETDLTDYCTGHPGAFGVSIQEKNIDQFIAKTDAALKDMPNESIYYVDYVYKGNEINGQDLISIANMEDLWGKDIDEPFIAIQHLIVAPDMITVYQKKDNTLKITLPNGVSLVKFKATDEQCYKLQNTDGYYEINVVGRANKNQWNGIVTPQIFIEDYQIIDSNNFYF